MSSNGSSASAKKGDEKNKKRLAAKGSSSESSSNAGSSALKWLSDLAAASNDSWISRLSVGQMCNIVHLVCSVHGSKCPEGTAVCAIAAGVAKNEKKKRSKTDQMMQCAKKGAKK